MRFVRRHTTSLEAYNLYLKARYQLLKGTPEGVARSKECFEQAIGVDPNYALAWCGLAEYYIRLGAYGSISPKEAKSQSLQAALKALELDDALAEAHSMVAVIRAGEFDWKGAEREFLSALELDPKSEEVWTYYVCFYLVPLRRLDEAVAASQRAVELNPLSPAMHLRLGHCYFLTRNWDRAIQELNTLELDSRHAAVQLLLGTSYMHTGKPNEAIRSLETCAQLMGRSPLSLGVLGWAYAVSGRTSEAQKLLLELQGFDQKTYSQTYGLGLIHLGLGEIDRCFVCLEKAVDERDPQVLIIPVLPEFDPIRPHPRYQLLLRKMNLEP